MDDKRNVVAEEREPIEKQKEKELANPNFMMTSLAADILQRKGVEYSAEVQENTEKAIVRLAGLSGEAAKEAGLAVNEADILAKIADTLDEAHGNFGKEKISFSDFVSAMADELFEVKLMAVEPLEYFRDIGNIADVDSLRAENDKLPEEIREIKDQPQKARALVAYIDETHHVGVDQAMYERDLTRGKDHNATMKYLLNKVAAGEALPPGFVGRFSGASEKYGQGKTGEALDGTHRATACAVTGAKFFVIEVDMDEMMDRVKR